MDNKLIRSIDALNGDQFNAQPGRVHGILFYFSGTNATATPGALADLGSVVVTRDGRQIANATIEELADSNDIRFGSNIFESVGSGTFRASAFLPFFESDDTDESFQNALSIVDESELNIEWIPASGIGAVFSSISVSVYSELAAYKERYEFRTLRDNQVEGGAVSSKPYQLNKDNISALYLSDPSSVVTLVQYENNNRSRYSPQSWDVLEANTLRRNKLEVTTFAMVELQMYTRGNAGSSVNRDNVISLTTSGAGTINVLTTSLHWWPQAQAEFKGQGLALGRGR